MKTPREIELIYIGENLFKVYNLKPEPLYKEVIKVKEVLLDDTSDHAVISTRFALMSTEIKNLRSKTQDQDEIITRLKADNSGLASKLSYMVSKEIEREAEWLSVHQNLMTTLTEAKEVVHNEFCGQTHHDECIKIQREIENG